MVLWVYSHVSVGECLTMRKFSTLRVKKIQHKRNVSSLIINWLYKILMTFYEAINEWAWGQTDMKHFHHSRDIDIEFYDNRLIINKTAQWGVNKTKLLAANFLAECRRWELKIGNKSKTVTWKLNHRCLKLEIKLSMFPIHWICFI